jgi:predicted YcjX-like family ATPase
MAKKDEDRTKRLAEALRANLRKRKESGREVLPVGKEQQPQNEEGLPS